MEKQHITALALSAIVILIAVQSIGCQSSNPNFVNGKDRVVTISSVTPGNSNPCEVDFPVTLLRISKKHTITWVADDHDYWIVFDPSGGFTSPIGTDRIKISQGSHPVPYPIKLTPQPSAPPTSPVYFNYWIYDKDPATVPPSQACKSSTDDHDTGLNVKP